MKNITKYLIHLPNAVTLLRFVLTGVFIGMLPDRLASPRGGLPLSIYILLGVICLSDVLDGAAARRLGAESTLGAVLDIAADCLYIFSALIIFTAAKILPLWYTLLVFSDFLFFLLTSGYLKRRSGGNPGVFVFDLLGKISAALYFLVPVVSCLAYNHPEGLPGLTIVLSISALLTAVSVLSRLSLCAAGRKKMIHS